MRGCGFWCGRRPLTLAVSHIVVVKILVASDLHLDQGRHSRRDHDTGLPTAWLSTRRCWRAACAAAVEQEVDQVVVTGDVFRNGAPSPEASEIMADGLRVLSEEHIPVLLIPGNHEGIGRPLFGYRHSLERMADIPGVTVASEHGQNVELAGGVVASIVPWPSARWLTDQEPLDQTGMLEAVSEKLSRFVEGVGDEAAIMFGHLAVAEAVAGGRRGSEVQMVSISNEPLIGIRELEEGPWGAIVLGHIHKRQRLGTKTHYVGSIDAHDFGDEGSPKGVSLVSIDGNLAPRVTTIPMPYRVMRTITLRDGESRSDVELKEGEILRIRGTDHAQVRDVRKEAERRRNLVTEVRVEPKLVERDAAGGASVNDDPSLWLDRWMERESVPAHLVEKFRAEATRLIDEAMSA